MESEDRWWEGGRAHVMCHDRECTRSKWAGYVPDVAGTGGAGSGAWVPGIGSGGPTEAVRLGMGDRQVRCERGAGEGRRVRCATGGKTVRGGGEERDRARGLRGKWRVRVNGEGKFRLKRRLKSSAAGVTLKFAPSPPSPPSPLSPPSPPRHPPQAMLNASLGVVTSTAAAAAGAGVTVTVSYSILTFSIAAVTGSSTAAGSLGDSTGSTVAQRKQLPQPVTPARWFLTGPDARAAAAAAAATGSSSAASASAMSASKSAATSASKSASTSAATSKFAAAATGTAAGGAVNGGVPSGTPQCQEGPYPYLLYIGGGERHGGHSGRAVPEWHRHAARGRFQLRRLLSPTSRHLPHPPSSHPSSSHSSSSHSSPLFSLSPSSLSFLSLTTN
ncbi:unnamed protein product [Closterium sp. Naga37s-1]|nr:unnamed protein product [Closterium sp. Naga37s-1]